MPADVEDRWLLRVDFGDFTGCWEWIGAKWSRGYGKFTIPVTQKRVAAHRWGYERFVGAVGDLDIDHLCRNHSCVNPDHLEPVSHYENMARGTVWESSHNALKTECERGHRFTPQNTYSRPDRPGRICRACGAENARKYRKAKNG